MLLSLSFSANALIHGLGGGRKSGSGERGCVSAGAAPYSVVKRSASLYSGKRIGGKPVGGFDAGTLMIKVAILGGSGYTAAELIKILLRHPEVNLAAVTTRGSKSETRNPKSETAETSDLPLLAELHPSLTSRIDLRCEVLDPDRLRTRGVQ